MGGEGILKLVDYGIRSAARTEWILSPSIDPLRSTTRITSPFREGEVEELPDRGVEGG